MTESSPNRPPLTLTINDLTQTRASAIRTSMRWPVDPDTTERLYRVVKLDLNSPIPWWRRVIRLLRR
jgi:hypothetical protein